MSPSVHDVQLLHSDSLLTNFDINFSFTSSPYGGEGNGNTVIYTVVECQIHADNGSVLSPSMVN